MNYRTIMSTTARATILVAGLGWASGAAAQTTTTSSPGTQLEDVIVTARKVTERLQDAPVSVTTITASTLEQRGIRDLAETVKLASSVKFDSDADVRAGIAIRGVGQSADVNAAPGVGLFVDGVYQPSSAYYTVPFFDVQRIEILKGPQGTLYGKNTLGGAISIISRDPGDHFAGQFAIENSTGNSTVANLALSTPFAGERFGARTSIFYRKTDGLQTNRTTGEGANMREDFAVRSRFVMNFNDRFNSAFSVFYADLKAPPFYYSTSNAGLNNPVDNVTKDINGLVESKYKSVNFTNNLNLGGAILTSLTSYDNAHVSTFGDADFTGTSALRVGGVLVRDTIAQELRLTSSNETAPFRWLVGAYYSDDALHSTNLSEANFGPLAGFRALSTGTKKEDGTNYAGFGQVTLDLGQLELLAGVRYDDETRHNVSASRSGLTGVLSTFDAEVESKAWQPKVSVSYHFTPDILGYGLVSRGFRAGGFNAITAPAADASYQPELTTNYEGGLKTEFLNRRARLNTAVFYTDYTDILITDAVRGTDGSTTVVSRNGGKAKSYGAELDGAFRISPELTVSGGYTYLNIKNDVIPTGLIRREVSGFSPHVFNAQIDYFHAMNNDVSFGAHASASYVGKTPLGTEVVERDAHTVVDASIDVNFQTFTLSVFGKNVFDEQYYTSYVPAASTATPGLRPRPTEPTRRVRHPAQRELLIHDGARARCLAYDRAERCVRASRSGGLPPDCGRHASTPSAIDSGRWHEIKVDACVRLFIPLRPAADPFQHREPTMTKPSKMATATAVFTAGICNGLVYTLGFLLLVLVQFVTKGGSGASFVAVLSSFVVTLIFSTVLATLITFIVAFPIAMIFRAFKFLDWKAYLIAPAIGAVIACAIASLLGVAWTTYVAIVAFGYIASAVMWLAFGRPGVVPAAEVNGHPA